MILVRRGRKTVMFRARECQLASRVLESEQNCKHGEIKKMRAHQVVSETTKFEFRNQFDKAKCTKRLMCSFSENATFV